jgi:outer membrane protein assembly factor BamE (lipoprotein component of BamABCDE complex)
MMPSHALRFVLTATAARNIMSKGNSSFHLEDDMMNIPKMALLLALAGLVLTGCTAQQHAADVRAAEDTNRLTVGTVQREIRMGMSAADVAEVLGSPNIVTTDDARNETWIYDKISSDVTYSRSSGAIVGLIFGGSGGGAGVGSSSAGSTSRTQRTLTVIIKFDENNTVRDFSYHSSQF